LLRKTLTRSSGSHALADQRRCKSRNDLDKIGLAIGAGTDVAIESAGMVLAGSDPRAVGAIIRLSRASYRKMWQNLIWAAGYNIIAVPVAAGALVWAGITMPPAVAAVLMSLSTVVVAINAQLLRRVELTPGRSTDR